MIHTSRSWNGAGWRSLLVVPFFDESEIVGVLAVRRRALGAFSRQTAELLETLANQSVVAIHNARVYRTLARYHTMNQAQAEELAAWNRQLERRVDDQLTELERLAATEAIPSTTAGRPGCRLGRRVVPREPPARGRRGLLRPARVHGVRRDESSRRK